MGVISWIHFRNGINEQRRINTGHYMMFVSRFVQLGYVVLKLAYFPLD